MRKPGRTEVAPVRCLCVLRAMFADRLPRARENYNGVRVQSAPSGRCGPPKIAKLLTPRTRAARHVTIATALCFFVAEHARRYVWAR